MIALTSKSDLAGTMIASVALRSGRRPIWCICVFCHAVLLVLYALLLVLLVLLVLYAVLLCYIAVHVDMVRCITVNVAIL